MTSSGPGDDMTLDDIVARVRELPSRLRSLYVETDGWTDWALSQRASARREELLAPSPPVDPDAQRTQHHVRTWMVFDLEHWDRPLIGVTPERWRAELEFTDMHGEVDVIVSGRDATAQWSERNGNAERHDPGGGMGSLHSCWVVGRQWLGDRVDRVRVDTDVAVLGRRCVRVRVMPRGGLWAPGPLAAGDEHLLDVDVETGMTLALTSLHDGEVISHHEVLSLELDPDVDASLTAPPEAAVSVSLPNYRDAREVAAAAEGLKLLVPTWLPEGYAFGTAGAGPREDGEMHAVLYYRRERSPTVMIAEFPSDPLPDDEVDGWTSVERAGRRVVVSDVTDAIGIRLAWLVVAGTRAMIRAELSAEEMLDVAFSLEPISP